MRFRSHALLAAGCVSFLALGSPVFGRPLPRDAEPKRQQSVRLPAPKPANMPTTKLAHRPTLKPKQVAQRPAPATAERAPVERISLSARMKPPFGWPALVTEARKYMGTNPTDRQRLWCATFMNFVLAKVGYTGTNSDAAKSFAYYGRRVSEPQVGAIAVLTRGRRGGHVGVVSGIDPTGNPIIISGNHNKRVGESVYPRSRVIAYVMPSDRRVVPTVVAARGPASQPSSEAGLESPITELLAAIEAEQARAEKPRPARPQVQPQAQRPQQETQPPQPVVPHRLVQQTADPAPQPRAGSRRGGSDPFSELFDRIERAPAQLARQPQAQPRHSRRVAAAETGRGSIR
jgi:uncharacterized protein (TIGR02594 family)